MLKELIKCCEELNEKAISGWWLNDVDKEDNHWTATLDVMKEELERDLTDLEITCLSLSRCFGPLPSIPEKDQQVFWKYLWPEGNPRGLRYDWSDLANKLLQKRIEELHCNNCGEQAYRDTATCPHTGEQVDAIVYCSTCSRGVCGTHGFEVV